MNRSYKALALTVALLSTAACSKGGNLVLEPGARAPRTKGSPFLNVNQGGSMHLVEQGKTETTGVHGYITVQAVSARNLAGANGVTGVINKTTAK
jgi:predicted small lipoprotein YifL